MVGRVDVWNEFPSEVTLVAFPVGTRTLRPPVNETGPINTAPSPPVRNVRPEAETPWSIRVQNIKEAWSPCLPQRLP